MNDVVNDLDWDFSDNLAAAAQYRRDQRNIRKVAEMTKKLNVHIMNPLRDGKRLLVLDIDYSKSHVLPLAGFAAAVAKMVYVQQSWIRNL